MDVTLQPLRLYIVPPKVELKGKGKEAVAARLAVNKSLISATTDLESFLPTALWRAMRKVEYAWPATGGIKGSPRTITDTGALGETLKLKSSFQKTRARIDISYTSPYAAFVYYGGAHKPYGNPNAATQILPGRPWIEDALKISDKSVYDLQEGIFIRFRAQLVREIRAFR